MSISLTSTTTDTRNPWPAWVRALVLIVGVALSAIVAYLTAMAVMIAAVVLGAAPLLAGDSTPQQPWVTPAAAAAGIVVLGLGVWLSFRTMRRHRDASRGESA